MGCADKGIDVNKAMQIALQDAQVNEGDATIYVSELQDRDDDDVYKVVFSANGKKYVYEIDADDGTIRKNINGNQDDIDDDGNEVQRQAPQNNNNNNNSNQNRGGGNNNSNQDRHDDDDYDDHNDHDDHDDQDHDDDDDDHDDDNDD